MKILKRNEINEIKSNERKFEIDAGLKLAKRVDELREIRNKEETNLNKFKDETIKIVQAEIDTLIKKKNDLDYEVRVLEGKNKLLMEPFDKEWERISNKRISELNHLDESLTNRQHDVNELEVELHERARLFFANENILMDKLAQAELNAEESEIKLKETKKVWAETRMRDARVNSELDAKLKNMETREADISYKERDISIREEAMRQAAKALADRERFVNDKYKTLERTMRAVGK